MILRKAAPFSDKVSRILDITINQIEFHLKIRTVRYLLQSKGRDRTAELYARYLESLEKLHEMAEILINKRLICW